MPVPQRHKRTSGLVAEGERAVISSERGACAFGFNWNCTNSSVSVFRSPNETAWLLQTRGCGPIEMRNLHLTSRRQVDDML